MPLSSRETNCEGSPSSDPTISTTQNLHQLRNKTGQALWIPTWAGLKRVYKEGRKVWNGSEGHLYRYEKSVFEEHVEPLKLGAKVGVYFFFVLTLSRNKRFINFRDRYIWGKEPQKTAEAILEEEQKVFKSYLTKIKEEEMERRKLSFVGKLQYFADAMVSFSIGLGTAWWEHDQKKMHNDLVALPLLPGKSLSHEIICPDVIKIFNEIDKEVLNFPPTEYAKYDMLVNLTAFASNCKIRSNYIKLQREAGSTRPDVVPYPGLDGRRRET